MVGPLGQIEGHALFPAGGGDVRGEDAGEGRSGDLADRVTSVPVRDVVNAAGGELGGEGLRADQPGRDDERLCLVNENSKWVVYYLERGVRTTELFFDSEEEACDCILKSFRE